MGSFLFAFCSSLFSIIFGILCSADGALSYGQNCSLKDDTWTLYSSRMYFFYCRRDHTQTRATEKCKGSVLSTECRETEVIISPHLGNCLGQLQEGKHEISF